MQLFSVSIGDIEDDIASYFETHYGVAPSALTPATDLKKLCSFSGAAWVDLGDALSDQPWMLHLGVRLAPNDMMVVSTLGQLATRILNKMHQVVAAPATAQVIPVNSLMAMSAKMPAAAPTPAPKGKKKRR